MPSKVLLIEIINRSSQGEELREIISPVVAVDGDPTYVAGPQHVLSVARTVYPALHRHFNGITAVTIEGNVLRE
jgi:hypothetical protein